MYVSFKLYSEAQMQLKLHKKLRIKIPEWENQGLLPDCEAELTYHPRSGFLQAVLNLSNIIPSERAKELSLAEIDQIPKEIADYIESLCNENQIRLERHNHGKEMDCGRKEEGEKYWCGMRNEEIARVCSNGTRITFKILDKLEKNREYFKDDPEVKQYISEQIQEKLGVGFEPCTCKFMHAWHETCNPIGIWKNFFVMTSLGLQNEEQLLETSKGNQALRIIKARSLDCRMVLTNWKAIFEGQHVC